MAGETGLPAGGHAARWRVLIAIGALYAGFGVMAALLQGGLPPILRAKGLSMDQIAWTFALYLPLGLSFLWAPLVDRFRLPFLSPRIGWIVAAQLVAVAGTVAVALLEGAPLILLFGVGLVVTLAAATMDLALDAMAVEMTDESLKPLAASLKLAALASGAVLGGGVFVGLLERLGWQTTFLLVALFLLASAVPVLGLVPGDRRPGPVQPRAGRWLLDVLRQPAMRWRLAMLMAAAGALFPLSSLNRVMLVDLGVPLDRIAWIVGTLQPLGLLGVSLVTAPLIRRLGHRGALLLLATTGFCCVAMLMGALHFRMPNLAITGTVGMATVVGGLMVVYAALMLSWAEGEQAATRYAVLFCGTRLAGIVTTVLAGKLVALIDWQAFYALGVIALLGSTAWLLHGLRSPGRQ